MTDKKPDPNAAFNLFGTGSTPVEPNPDQRRQANQIYELYSSYVQAGFTPDQAMTIITEVMKAHIHRGGTDV